MDADDPDDAFALLCAAIGPEATARLRDAAAGCLVYVPASPAPHTRLAQIIGLEGCVAASAAIGSGDVYVRADRAAERAAVAARHAEIRRLRAAGLPIREICRRVGVSTPLVKKVLRKRHPGHG